MKHIQRYASNHKEVLNKNHKMMVELAKCDTHSALSMLKTNPNGLSCQEASRRNDIYGNNKIIYEKTKSWYMSFLICFKNPFIFILIAIGIISFITNDIKSATIAAIIVILSSIIRFIQEFRAQKWINKLKEIPLASVTVLREKTQRFKQPNTGQTEQSEKVQVSPEKLVPGDIIFLSAGNIVPADVRILSSKNLLVNQSTITGEVIPVEKSNKYYYTYKKRKIRSIGNLIELENLCFMGTHIMDGFAKAVVISTGANTSFGFLTKTRAKISSETSFDKGISKVSWLFIQCMLIMIPFVMVIDGVMKGDWQEAFLFAVAIAIGLTPEMLPMIVTANLAKGAVNMSKKKVIIKQLSSIYNLGAMDILCTDKTGTLTEENMQLVRCLNNEGKQSKHVFRLAYLNSYFQTGTKNEIDQAILQYTQANRTLDTSQFSKVIDFPFDFKRRRTSSIVKEQSGKQFMVCKGSVQEVLSICSHIQLNHSVVPITNHIQHKNNQLVHFLYEQGLRVIAVAYKECNTDTSEAYSTEDESDMVLVGFLGFLNPPKQSAISSLRSLQDKGVAIKILTGDDECITKNICKKVGIDVGEVVLGYEIDRLPERALAKLARKTTAFAKLNPTQKLRIIKTLQQDGHTVGFLGDGINDVLALKEADIGISVKTADNIAQECSDMMLLEKDLDVLEIGIIEGRKTFGNILKYMKMAGSSNFGNACSLLLASIFIPFVPLLPIQLLVQNLLYNLSQLSIPWDTVDKEFLEKPRKWDTKDLRNFILCIGPISCIFDVITFSVLWNVFSANTSAEHSLFQAGWFIVGLLTQTLIVHMIRTQHIPFIQSTASSPVLLLTTIIMIVGMYLPFSPFSEILGFSPLPFRYFLWVIGIIAGYAILTQLLKRIYIKTFHSWL
ncbi:magnesium-translocating P-type ATPase [Bacillus sp. C1]